MLKLRAIIPKGAVFFSTEMYAENIEVTLNPEHTHLKLTILKLEPEQKIELGIFYNSARIPVARVMYNTLPGVINKLKAKITVFEVTHNFQMEFE